MRQVTGMKGRMRGTMNKADNRDKNRNENLLWKVLDETTVIKDAWIDMRASTCRLPGGMVIAPSYYKVVVFIDSLQGLYAILLEILWIVYHPLPLDGL